MALKPCTVCGRPTTGSRCPAHHPRNGSTRSWRQLPVPASEVDHITPLAYGGSDDPANLRSLCPACHHAAH